MEQRLEKHNRARRGYTATKQPWKVVHTESFEMKTDALKREKYIKGQKSRIFIERLADGKD
ncbi:MAG: GIY-YIG nuclease family protein [Bacteroidota bacterium]